MNKPRLDNLTFDAHEDHAQYHPMVQYCDEYETDGDDEMKNSEFVIIEEYYVVESWPASTCLDVEQLLDEMYCEIFSMVVEVILVIDLLTWLVQFLARRVYAWKV